MLLLMKDRPENHSEDEQKRKLKMSNINYIFFEEFKNLEKLCNDMFQSHNGVTNYIDEMQTVSYGNHCHIPAWDSDLKQLKRLRHIRNHMAHEAGGFEDDICTRSDVDWIQDFYERILKQSDPLALLHQNLLNRTNIVRHTKKTIHPPKEEQKFSEVWLFTVLIFIITIFLFFLLLLQV